MLSELAAVGVVFNTSTSALDSADSMEYRVGQFYRVRSYGCRSMLRIVTARFGDNESGKCFASIQRWLVMHGSIIDTPLRLPASDSRVAEGTILVERIKDLNSRATVSRWRDDVYIGHCGKCPDQCGAQQ